MKRVYLSFYSAGNLGDDLFVYHLARSFEHQFEVQLNRYSVTLCQLKNLKVRWNPIRRVLTRMLPRAWSDAIARRREVALSNRNDLTLLVGGSLFIETGDGDDFAKLAHYRNLRKPLYIAGVNVGPVRTDPYRKALHRLAKDAKAVIVRDERSFGELENAGNVFKTTDLLFSLELPKAKRQYNNIAISVIHPERKGYSADLARRYFGFLSQNILEFVGSGFEVSLYGFCEYEGDGLAAREVLKLLPRSMRPKIDVVIYSGDIDLILAKFLQAEYVVASRFHAAVLALKNGASIYPISYGGKLENLLFDIEYGSNTYSLEAPDFLNNKIDINDFDIVDVSNLVEISRSSFDFLN